MAGYQKNNRNRSEDSISDQACTRCRERKIRCGRELPQCNNCERDDSVTCLYQNPTKRVNHLKSLFDSVNGVKERLINIESHLGRLAVSIEQNMDHDHSFPASSSTLPAPVTGMNDVEDDEDRAGSPGPYGDDCTDLQFFRNQVDMVDYYHGPLSLFVLCKQFQTYALSISNAECRASLRDMLQNLCDRAGVVEPFPPFGGQSVVNLLPKYQATTVIGHFLQRVDCATDVFVKSNLLAQVERIYSQPTEPGDDVWTICFQAITVLVWGMEISAQGGNGLFGDFAHLFLPSRAALVNSRLLTTPKLINVQTLILLSIAAQQFDPPGWAEFIFANACGLARTMGLHHTQLLPHETSTYEKLERAKVIQALYVRDKSLCTTRGSVSWLPTHDCNISSQLSAAIERQSPYHDTLQLAMIQDDIYRLTHSASFRASRSSRSQMAKVLRSLEHQLDQYIHTFGLFNSPASSYNSRLAMLTMEFLNTRILALQLGSEQRHVEQVRSDARASCLLLLIAHGIQESYILEAFDALTYHKSPGGSITQDETTPPTIKPNSISFTSILDAFSLPAFFTLLKHHLESAENHSNSASASASAADFDLDLLQRVSTCYVHSTDPMQGNSYHQKVSWTFENLLKTTHMLKNPEHQHHSDSTSSSLSSSTSSSSSTAPALTSIPMSHSHPHALLPLNTQPHTFCDISPSSSLGDDSGFSFLSQASGSASTNTPFSWDICSSITEPMGFYKAFGSVGEESGISSLMGGSIGNSTGSPERSVEWVDGGGEMQGFGRRKRVRTGEGFIG